MYGILSIFTEKLSFVVYDGACFGGEFRECCCTFYRRIMLINFYTFKDVFTMGTRCLSWGKAVVARL